MHLIAPFVSAMFAMAAAVPPNPHIAGGAALEARQGSTVPISACINYACDDDGDCLEAGCAVCGLLRRCRA